MSVKIRQLATEIAKIRYTELWEDEDVDRDTLIVGLCETLPPSIFEVTDSEGKPSMRLGYAYQNCHKLSAKKLAMRLGSDVRKVYVADDPAEEVEAMYDVHRDNPAARMPAIHCLWLLFHADLPEPYTFLDVYRASKGLDEIELIEEAARSEASPGAVLKTFREVLGIPQWKLGELIGLATADYTGSGNKVCPTVGSWECDGVTPGRRSMRKLLRYAKKLRDRKKRLEGS